MDTAAAGRARRWTVAALVTNIGIVVTGGIVRLSGSGLGCVDWPTCDGTSVVPAGDEATWHTFVEFGNRLLTFVVLAACVGAWLAVRRLGSTDAVTRRAALLLPLGVVAQALLGGVTVLTGLHPLTVAAHFLLSAGLIGVAVVLLDRLDRPDAVPAGPTRRRTLATALVPLGGLVLLLGTLVTASGPHAGDPGTQRLGLSIPDITRAHGVSVWLVVAATVGVVVLARRAGDLPLATAAGTLLVVELVQGAVGYWQYALGVPQQLVAIHLLLACLFWAAAVRTALVARRAEPTRAATPEAAPAGVA